MTTLMKTKEGRRIFLFMSLCTMVYFTSYLTRINYGAVITEIIDDMTVTKRQAGMVSTAAFFTYGVGQLISGFIGDKVKPRLLIIIGMTATAVCNILMPFMGSIAAMTLLWGVNGFCQAMFWPPLVRMMVTHLDKENYNRACVWVSAASSAATIVVYLLAPVCIELSGWKTIFFIGAVGALLMALAWHLLAPKGDAQPKKPSADDDSPSILRNRTIMLMLIPMAVVIILQGILRDGVTTWMPTLIADTFSFSSSVSILTGIVLPIFGVFSYNAAAAIQRKLNNEVVTAAVLFGTGAAAALALIPLFDKSPAAAVVMMALITGCMHGVNLMLISRVPPYFRKYGKVSTISGLLNAFTYVGSSISTYFVAVLEESFGWHFTIVTWFVVAAVGTAVCVYCVMRWKRFLAENEE
ncbi:MAG: MFS transporter [Clostridia bacterium]|nr:MFS transporter [Clostridia bacterium]